MSKKDKTLQEEWKNSRSGAWAARGFDFQHLVTVLILVRQWTGLYPAGNCVPEGLEDCVIELADRELWIQIKSKHSGLFSRSDVRSYLEKLGTKVKKKQVGESVSCALILEQECNGVATCPSENLFICDDSSVIVYEVSENDIIDIIRGQLVVANIIAEGIFNDLYRLVADVATKNASLLFHERRRISPSEIDRKITLRLEAGDPSHIDEALKLGIIEAADFSTEIHDLDFYRGVKSKLGHVTSGQIHERPEECRQVVELLKQTRQVILTGPSGAGKSGLLWLVATAISSWGKWFEIKPTASITDANTVIRFIRSRQPKPGSPILIAMDEIGIHNAELWGVLSSQLRSLNDVYLIGTTRIEDLVLIQNQSSIRRFNVSLDEKLAQSLWEKFQLSRSTEWSHWREPFEMSNGLLLEYTHILSEGGRLSSVINDQIRQREQEKRFDELSIIRICSVASAYGGEVCVEKLLQCLEIPLDQAKAAIDRLLDEHLVRESRAGVIGGLHLIRSKALKLASHDEVVYQASNSLLKAMSCVTNDSRPRVIQLRFADCDGDASTTIDGLANVLEENNDSETWVSVLTGLGLATLEQNVSAFLAIIEDIGLERAFWPLAAMFNDPMTSVSDIPNQDNFLKLAEIVRQFRSLSTQDLRERCLELLPDGTLWPNCEGIEDTNEMLASLLPITGCRAIDSQRIKLRYELGDSSKIQIKEIACLLSSALLVKREIADEMLAHLGGEENLYSIFYKQIPWSQFPTIEVSENGERTVRSDWYLVSEEHQPDPHQAVCEICETLIGLSLDSDFSASNAVNAKGEIIGLGDIQPWSKRMPRNSNPARARVAWNVAFGELVIIRANTISLTQYVDQMSNHIRTAQEILLSVTEDWIRGTKLHGINESVAMINDTLVDVRSVSYADIAPTPTSVSAPASQRSSEAKLGQFITAILDNLLLGVVKASTGEGAKATATFAGKLHEEALVHMDSDIWRVVDSPPYDELSELSKRLEALSQILHELDYDNSPKKLDPLIKIAKKTPKGKGVYAVSKRCIMRADKRLADKMRKLRAQLKTDGWTSDSLIRRNDRHDCPYWPASEIAILVELPNFQSEERDWVECLGICNEEISMSWPFSIVPVVNKRVVPSMALVPSNSSPVGFLPDTNFESKWGDVLKHRFASTHLYKCFESIVSSCIEISSYLSCLELKSLHADEELVLSKIAEFIEHGTDQLIKYADAGELDECPDALNFVRDIRESLALEIEGHDLDLRLCDQLIDDHSKFRQRYMQIIESLILAGCYYSSGG